MKEFSALLSLTSLSAQTDAILLFQFTINSTGSPSRPLAVIAGEEEGLVLSTRMARTLSMRAASRAVLQPNQQPPQPQQLLEHPWNIPGTTTIMTSNKHKEDNGTMKTSLDLTQLKSWHELWCQQQSVDSKSESENLTQQGHNNDSLSSSSSAAAAAAPINPPAPQDPLLSARIWIKQNCSALMQDQQQLSELLKWLLRICPPMPPSGNSHRSHVVAGDTAKQSTATATADTNQWIIRQIEWIVVLFLELRVRCEASSLEHLFWRFAKVAKKTSVAPVVPLPGDKRKRKRKRSTALAPQAMPEEYFQSYLVEQLTRLVFLLPSQEPLETVLCQRFLTKYMWKRIPTVVTSLLESFEVENPYLPKPAEQDDDDDQVHVVKKRKVKASQDSRDRPPTTRRPLVAVVQRPDRRRMTHFHGGMWTDLEKLLDVQEPWNGRPGTTKMTNQNQPRPKPTITITTKKGYIITPHQQGNVESSATEKQSTDTKRGSQAGPANDRIQTNRPVANQAESALHSPVPSRKPPVVAETPLPAACSASRYTAETPMTVLRPVTALGETPSSNVTRGTAVTETPLAEPHGGRIVDDSPVSPRRNPHDKAMVKPLKLFAALQPVSKSRSSKSLSVPPLPTPTENPTTTNTSSIKANLRSSSRAVAAARSFLRRKSR